MWLWAVDVKRSLAPHPAKGFHSACEDLQPERRFVVYPDEDRYPLGSGAEAIAPPHLARLVQGAISEPRRAFPRLEDRQAKPEMR